MAKMRRVSKTLVDFWRIFVNKNCEIQNLTAVFEKKTKQKTTTEKLKLILEHETYIWMYTLCCSIWHKKGVSEIYHVSCCLRNTDIKVITLCSLWTQSSNSWFICEQWYRNQTSVLRRGTWKSAILFKKKRENMLSGCFKSKNVVDVSACCTPITLNATLDFRTKR